MGEFERILSNYGVVAAVICFLLKMHWDTVYRVIPGIMSEIKIENRRNRLQLEKVIKSIAGIECNNSKNALRQSPRKRKRPVK